MKRFFMGVLLIVLTFQSFAQFRISGKLIQEKDSLAVEYALIRAFDSKDSLLAGATSGASGAFNLVSDIKPLKLQISSIAFQDSVFFSLTFDKDNMLDFGTILLQPHNFSLDEVNVTGKVDQIDHQVGKSVYNFSKASKTSAGDAFEMLDQVPGINIDHANETVKINGKENILYLVNGIPQVDNKVLKTIQPKDVKGVEIVTAPSGKYNPMEYSAVLNIILKEKVPQGFSLTAQTSIESILRSNQGRVNLSYGHGAVRTFFNYGLYTRNADMSGERWRTNKLTGEELHQKEVYDNTSGLTHHLDYGMDYYIDSLNVLSVKGMNYISNGNPEYSIENQLTNTLNPLSFVTGIKKDRWYTYAAYTLYYQHKFKREGQEFSLQTDFYQMGSDTKTETHEKYSDQNDRYYNEKAINQKDYLKVRADFTLPIVKGHSLNLGSKYYFQNIDNSASGYINSESKYVEQRVAGYLDYTFSKEKFSTNIGFRAEQPQVLIDDVDQQRKFQFTPYANINYQLDKIGFTLKYSRETWFQGYWHLNPNITRIDSLNYSQGNPDLRPTIQQRASLDINHQVSKKINVSYSLSYSRRDNEVVYIMLPYKDDTWIKRPVDEGESDQYSLYISGQYKITPKLNISLSGSVDYGMLTADLSEMGLNINKQENFSGWGSARLNWQLPKDFSVSGSYYYSGTNITHTGQSEYPDYWRIDFSKRFSKRAKLNLIVYNIFSSQESRTFEESDIYKSVSHDTYEYKGINLRFTYNFSTGKRFRPIRTKNVEKD